MVKHIKKPLHHVKKNPKTKLQKPNYQVEDEPSLAKPRIYQRTREIIQKQGYLFRNTNNVMLEKLNPEDKYSSYIDEDTHRPMVYANPIIKDVIAEGIKISRNGLKPVLLAIKARDYIEYATPVISPNKENQEIRISTKVDFIKNITIIDSLNKLEEILSLARLPFNSQDKMTRDFEKYYLS